LSEYWSFVESNAKTIPAKAGEDPATEPFKTDPSSRIDEGKLQRAQ